jgi:hypothetical protein
MKIFFKILIKKIIVYFAMYSFRMFIIDLLNGLTGRIVLLVKNCRLCLGDLFINHVGLTLMLVGQTS